MSAGRRDGVREGEGRERREREGGREDTGKIGRGFGKNASEWTGRVEINKEKIPSRKRSIYDCMLTYSRI